MAEQKTKAEIQKELGNLWREHRKAMAEADSGNPSMGDQLSCVRKAHGILLKIIKLQKKSPA